MWGRSGDGLSTHCSETTKSVRIRTRVGLNSRFCRELRCAPIPLRDLGGLLDSLLQLLNQLYVRSIQPPGYEVSPEGTAIQTLLDLKHREHVASVTRVNRSSPAHLQRCRRALAKPHLRLGCHNPSFAHKQDEVGVFRL